MVTKYLKAIRVGVILAIGWVLWNIGILVVTPPVYSAIKKITSSGGKG